MIEEIQKCMLEYGFNITEKTIHEWLENNKIETFDTLEQGDLLQYIAKKYTDMDYPCNGDSQEYKDKFWNKLMANAKK